MYMAAGTYMANTDAVILRSTDRGASFTSNPISNPSGGTVPMGGNVEGRSMGERLAIDPNLTSKLYFASRGVGLMASMDSGTTWSQVTSFPVIGGKSAAGNKLGLSFALFDPKSGAPGTGSATIYVGVADITEGSNLYVSNDTGSTWQLIPGGPSQWTPHRAAFDSDGVLYVAFNGVAPTPAAPTPTNPVGIAGSVQLSAGGIWKFDPVTSVWTDITPPAAGGIAYGGVTTDLAHPGTVIVTTLDWWAPDEISRSTNGGSNWTAIGNSAQHNPNGAEWLFFGKTGCANLSSQGWMGDVEIDPFDSNHVMYVTGQGVWNSQNADAAAAGDILWTFEDRNLEQTAVTDMVPSVNGAYLSCVGDIGGMRNDDLDKPSPSGMYRNPTYSNCSSLDFAANNPNIVARAGSGAPAAYSNDNGQTWTPFANVPVGGGATCTGGKLAVSADGTTILWSVRCTLPRAADASTTTTTSAIAVSSDFGTTWTLVTGLPTNASIAADRSNPNKFYGYAAGSPSGTVYASTDAGKSFAAAQNTGVTFTGGGSLRVPFGTEGDVWLATTATKANPYYTLYHSTESGANFAQVAQGLFPYYVGFGKAAAGENYPAIYFKRHSQQRQRWRCQ